MNSVARHISMSRRLAMMSALLAMVGPVNADAKEIISVAAAADLRFALEELAAKFEASAGTKPRLTFGSSGNLARQIAQGAPFTLFLSADESITGPLMSAGHAEPPGAIYAIGRLALIATRALAPHIERGLAALPALLASGAITRFAIANPEHAPYGRAARQALATSGVWPAVSPRIVLGENVAQALQYVTTGAAEAGLVAAPLLTARSGTDGLAHGLIPAELHAPLRQHMVLVRSAGAPTRAFYDFIAGPDGQAILTRHGFERP